MDTVNLNVTIPQQKLSLVKKLLVELGGTVSVLRQKAAAAPKRPLTKVERDFVEAYKEMEEADRDGRPLQNARDFLVELEAEEKQREGQKV